MRKTIDETLLERATQLERVLVSADEDFAIIARQWQKQDIAFSGIVRLTQDLKNIGLYVRELELVAKAMDSTELANRITFIPL